jgi:predicted Zn-dependent protease
LRRERGRWLLQLGRNEEAAAELARTVREAPEDAEAQQLLRDVRRSAAGGN